MSELNDRRYYRARAQFTLELARRTLDPAIASIHMEAHDRYAALADGLLAGQRLAMNSGARG